MAATARVLLASPLLTVSDVACDAPRSGCGRERCDPASSITVIRRGVHAYHARRRATLAEAGQAILYRGGEPYRLSHPFERDQPDRSTCVEFGAALLEEAFGPRMLGRDLGTPLSAGAQVLALRVTSVLARHGGGRLASEERALALVRAIAGEFDLAPDDPDLPAPVLRRVERARAFIAARPAADPGLEAVAGAAGCSPFHLARLFRRQTGMTLRGYRLRLRLATVLDHLADGASDLAAVAVQAGFSDHSHMTTAFRKVFGATPSALREELGGRGLRRRSKFLQAAARGRA